MFSCSNISTCREAIGYRLERRLECVTGRFYSPKFEFFILNPHYYNVIEHSLKYMKTCLVLLMNIEIRILESSDESINCRWKNLLY